MGTILLGALTLVVSSCGGTSSPPLAESPTLEGPSEVAPAPESPPLPSPEAPRLPFERDEDDSSDPAARFPEAEVQWPTDVDALLAFALKAEEEEDYRTHCQVVDRLEADSSAKQVPRVWLERSKCKLRIGEISSALDSVAAYLDGTTVGSRPPELTRLALKIKALATVHNIDRESKSCGFSEHLLPAGIESWEAVRAHARATGDESTVQRAEREIADLEMRFLPAD